MSKYLTLEPWFIPLGNPDGSTGSGMPFCSVCRQFFGFIPGSAHILYTDLVWQCPSSFSLAVVASSCIPSLSVSTVTVWQHNITLVCGIVESSIINRCPIHLSLLSLISFTIVSSVRSYYGKPSSVQHVECSEDKLYIIGQWGLCTKHFVRSVNY